MPTRARCWPRRSAGGGAPGGATGSSPRPAATPPRRRNCPPGVGRPACRRGSHWARAARGPDETFAAELEGSAGRAQARGGRAAAAAFLERAAALTPDRARRAARALAAAAAKVQAGAFEAAGRLLGMAEAGPLDESQRARADLLRARLTFGANRGNDAPPLLLKAAKRLEPIDAGLARDTYLDALNAALFAGRLASPG